MKEEKEIRQQLLDSLPDKGQPNSASFIKAKYIERQEAKKKKKGGFRLAWAMPVAVVVLAAAIVTPLAINGGGGVVDPVNPDSGSSAGSIISSQGGGGNTQVLEVQNKHQDVAENLESGIHFLTSGSGDISTNNRALAKRLLVVADDDDEPTISNELLISHLKDLNPFLPTAERMMEGGSSASSLTYTEGEEYPYTLVTEDGDILHYFERRLDGKEDEEEEFYMEGYCEIDGTSYSMKGTREKEVSSSESEYETEFTISLDSGYSVTISSETENEGSEYEESYAYLYAQNGRTLLEVELDYENELGEEEKLTIEVKTSGKEAKYYLYENTDGFSLQYEIKGSDSDYKGNLMITISEALYIYKDIGGNEIASLPRG